MATIYNEQLKGLSSVTSFGTLEFDELGIALCSEEALEALKDVPGYFEPVFGNVPEEVLEAVEEREAAQEAVKALRAKKSAAAKAKAEEMPLTPDVESPQVPTPIVDAPVKKVPAKRGRKPKTQTTKE